jgi:hypothetical protein
MALCFCTNIFYFCGKSIYADEEMLAILSLTDPLPRRILPVSDPTPAHVFDSVKKAPKVGRIVHSIFTCAASFSGFD